MLAHALRQTSHLEGTFLNVVQPALEKIGVQVVQVEGHVSTQTIDVTIMLPKWVDRGTRHDVLAVLAEFEHDHDHAVTTNPTFVWDDDPIDV